MRFAMILLAVLGLACLAGSVIPQGNVTAWYVENYSETVAGLVMFLRLDDVFHSVWFLTLAVLLCLSLIFCNLSRFPSLIRRTKTGFTLEARRRESGHPVLLETEEKPEAVFQKLDFRKVENSDGALYAARNRAGVWGAWLTHLGILILIIGFGFGEVTQFETAVYGIPGDTLPIEGTDYAITIGSFDILLREDDTVDQYVSAFTVTDLRTGAVASGQTEVNHPAGLFGLKFYQNSTGWGASVTVLKDGVPVQEDFICAGEFLHVEAFSSLHLMLRAFYPDYALDEAGQPVTASSAIRNPAYLYMLYYGDELLGMNVLTGNEVITVDDVTIAFHDPQPYTLLQVKRDPLEKVALVGGLVILLALILSFYVQPLELWALEDPETGRWNVYGKSRRGAEQIRELVTKAKEGNP